MVQSKKFICPCCGYSGLEQLAYQHLESEKLPVSPDLDIPYSKHFGKPSYEVCDCCGYEFGNDDDPGTAEGESFKKYREEWVAAGCKWFNEKKRPQGWSVEKQLEEGHILS
jgi:hypothetical protein